MTISEALIQWLYGYGNISVDESIDTDMLAANAEAYGLYKTPQMTIIPYVNGSRDITAYYTLCVRQLSNQETTRQSNQQWLESLEAWVRKQYLARLLPDLGSERECYAVGIANTFSLQDTTNDETVYQLTIMVGYTEKGDDQ